MRPLLLYVLPAIFAGALIACQSPINARLGQVMGDSVWATTVSFLIGSTVLLTYVLAFRGMPAVDLDLFRWWMLLGGVLGAVFVTTTIILVPQIGVTAMLCLLVAGQLMTGLALDHFGILVAQNTVTPVRLAGVALVMVGALLAQKF
jgi:bacterial/archaeal transporter family-2 protein